METFRLHLHDSGVQHVLTAPDHEALRITIVGDEECLVSCGMNLEGSNDNINWFFLAQVAEGATNEQVVSPYLYLRASGYGEGDSNINGLVTVEYLATVPDDGSVTISNTPLEVTGTVEAGESANALAQNALNENLLKEILAELKKQTLLLEEMHS